MPLILLLVTAHLLLHVSDITADPLDKPVQLQHLIPGVFQVVPLAASCKLQLLDLMCQREEDGDEMEEMTSPGRAHVPQGA